MTDSPFPASRDGCVHARNSFLKEGKMVNKEGQNGCRSSRGVVHPSVFMRKDVIYCTYTCAYQEASCRSAGNGSREEACLIPAVSSMDEMERDSV